MATASFNQTISNSILNSILGTTGILPSNIYVGLSTSTPTQDGTNISEPSASGTGYSRVTLANNSVNFPNASNGEKTNGTLISFPQATNSWGVVTHLVFFNALIGGTFLFALKLNSSRQVASNDSLFISIGELRISLPFDLT